MKISFMVTTAAVALLSIGSASATIVNLHGTGFDLTGAPLANGGFDGSWSNGATAGIFIGPASPDFFPGYAPNTNTDGFNGSGWISNNAASSTNGPAPYTYSSTFDLTQFILGSVAISGQWSIADGGTLRVNGNLIDTLSFSTSPWTALHPFSVTNTAFLNPGLNTISMTVTQSDGDFEALRLQGSVSGTLTATPEPSTFSLLAIGGLALLIRRRS